ncbi:MAG: FkbM family methyltransferase [Acidimicrobiales bacterium]
MAVDLGANIGLFSILAATEGAQVVAVEAQSGFLPVIEAHASLNCCRDRVKVLHALVSPGTGILASQEERSRASHWGSDPESLTFENILARCDLKRIDFLKVDIEGSEFDLFRDDLRWLDIVKKLVMEVHLEFGDATPLLNVLGQRGFRCELVDDDGQTVSALRDGGYLFASRSSLGGESRESVEMPV